MLPADGLVIRESRVQRVQQSWQRETGNQLLVVEEMGRGVD